MDSAVLSLKLVLLVNWFLNFFFEEDDFLKVKKKANQNNCQIEIVHKQKII